MLLLSGLSCYAKQVWPDACSVMHTHMEQAHFTAMQVTLGVGS